VLCCPDDLHIAESPRLVIVTSRRSDFARWWRMMADDPVQSRDLSARDRRLAGRIDLGAVADPVDSAQALLPVDPNLLFFAGIDPESRQLVSGLTVRSRDGVSELGGAVHHDFRGQGYGHEMLQTVCGLVHRHFGIERLVAGCEVTNAASRRWLAGAGFTPTPGPARHTLPGGRVIEATWCERTDPDAALRCHRPRPGPGGRLLPQRVLRGWPRRG
jgi:RimJ/RimL family protein N-acetyltransferase